MSLPARTEKPLAVAQLLDSIDVGLCSLLNRSSHLHSVRNLFRTVSRLGDGVIWYTMMLVLPVIGGYTGLAISAHMALTALAGLLVYKLTKQLSGRERPYVRHADRVDCAMPPLDRYSFPSGHTLHAVSFTIVLCSYFPEMVWVLLPFAVLIGLSRMILGLHYPSDVLAGTLIGAGIALGSFDLLALFGHAAGN
jgi:undecaprenyl-diphosphatase